MRDSSESHPWRKEQQPQTQFDKRFSTLAFQTSAGSVTNSNTMCRNPTLAKCGGEAQHLEKVRTPECLELDSKAQNTSHWGVLGVIGKVLKRRYRKCPRIGHLDICRPSYGQKKGRESNCQFDSRPLKVGNRPLPEVRIGSAIRRWKDLDEGYKFGSDLVAIRSRSREL